MTFETVAIAGSYLLLGFLATGLVAFIGLVYLGLRIVKLMIDDEVS